MEGKSRFHNILYEILSYVNNDISQARVIIEESENFTDLEKNILIRLLDDIKRYEGRINKYPFN